MWIYSLSSFIGGIFSFMCLHGLSLVKTFRVVTFLLSYGFDILFEKMRWSFWFGSVSTCTLKVAKEGGVIIKKIKWIDPLFGCLLRKLKKSIYLFKEVKRGP